MSFQFQGSAVEVAYQVDYWNGFGFQYDPSNKTFYVAGVSDSFDLKTLQRNLALTEKQCRVVDWLGYNFVSVSLDMYERIPDILNEVLALGFTFTTHTRPKVFFDLDSQFSRRDFELRLIQQATEHARIFPGNGRQQWQRYIGLTYETVLKPHNWATSEGRAFCARLRETLGLPERDGEQPRMLWDSYERATRENQILHCGGWGKYTPDLGDNLNDNNEEEEGEECMICLSNPPNTMVLPCQHVVVCKECSDQLKNTNDAHICTQCRCPITEVLFDE